MINLDMGARSSVITPYFGAQGFAAPRTPQPMQLDPGAMVHQSRMLRDDTMDIRNQASAILNRTEILAEGIEEGSQRVGILEVRARMSADLSRRNAELAEAYLNRTVSIYNETQDYAQLVNDLKRRISWLENGNASNADRPAYQVELALNLNYNGSREMASLVRRVELLEERISKLEAKGQL